MLTVLLVIFSIVALLVLHEFGHFIVAKKFGVKVEEFGVGYPPKIIGKKMGETVYSLNLFPFGAFVRIAGEENEETSVENSRLFNKKPAWQRALILLGGVFSFWIVAFILLTLVFGIGVSQGISDEDTGFLNTRIQILSVSKDSPALLAGIKDGDILSGFYLEDKFFSIDKVSEVNELTEANKGKEIGVSILRGDKEIVTSLIPRVSPPSGEGLMGVSLIRVGEKSFSWLEAPVKGLRATIVMTGTVVELWIDVVSNLIKGSGLPAGVQFVGPIGIGSMLNDAARIGINYFLQLMSTLAVYLAVLNMIPIPALDGGRLIFLAIEKIKGSPVNRKIEQGINSSFFLLMLCLMAWVTIRDISNLI